MSPQQNTGALTTKRAMQFITTTGEIFGGQGLPQCKMNHEAFSHNERERHAAALPTCYTAFYIFFNTTS